MSAMNMTINFIKTDLLFPQLISIIIVNTIFKERMNLIILFCIIVFLFLKIQMIKNNSLS